MAKLLKLRRGTTSQHGSFTGAEGEVTVDTDKETLVVHDGSTAGGHPVAAEDMANVSSANIVGRLGSGSIATAKLANLAVTDAKIANSTITGSKIAGDAINGNHIGNDVINSEHYAATSIDAEHIANNSVLAQHIADGNVTTAKIADDAVTYAKIQNVTATNVVLGRDSSGAGVIEQISAANLRTMINVENGATADQTSTEIKSLLAGDNIGAAQIADNSIGAGELADGSVGHNHIVADAVRASEIQNGAVNRDHLDCTNTGSNGQALTRAGSQFTWTTISVDGGNAATVDGIDSSQFLRSDAADSASGDITFAGGAGASTIGGGSDIRLHNGSWTGDTTHAKIQHHNGQLYICGGTGGIRFRENNTDRWEIDGGGTLAPTANNTYDIGTSTNRVKDIYTNDLNLSNEGGSNDVDGTWGSYTIQEGEDALFLINRRNGKKYQFNLTEVS